MAEIPDSTEIAYFVCYWIAGSLMMLFVTVHVYRVYSDLCTEARGAVQHRVKPPTLRPSYKGMAYLTLICVICYTMAAVFLGNQMTDGSDRKSCVTAAILVYWTYMPAKGSMFMIFMFRLDVCYSQSSYGYSKTFVYTMVAINAFLSLFVPAISNYWLIEDMKYDFDADDFPHPCWQKYNGVTVAIVAMVVLWDFGMNTLSLVLFIVPLRKTLKALGPSESLSKGVSKMSNQMIYIAVKFTVLAAVASLSTFFAALLVITDLLPYLQAFDVVINSVCIMMMTPYYPDDIYFEKCCKLCLLCCPAQFRKYQSRASRGKARRKNDPQTKDTASAFRGIDEEIRSPESTIHQSEYAAGSTQASSMQTQIQLGVAGGDADKPAKDITPAPPDTEA